MSLFRFVLISCMGTMFTVRVKDATFSGTRAEVLDKLNGDWSCYRNRTVYRYEVSNWAYSIIVHVA